MSKRYYYDCPLKAAFMVKYYGMEISKPKGGSYKASTLAAHQNWSERGFQKQPVRYYIHLDSLHLLEPIEHDVAIIDDRAGANALVWWRNGMDKDSLLKIIERDREPFMWPESEEP